MNQEIHHVSLEDFIRTGGTGVVDLEESKANLQNLCEIWKLHSSQNVLFDLRERIFDLSPRDLQVLIDEVVKTGLGTFNRVALLYRHRATFDHAKFLEFLAARHGLHVKSFEDFEEAVFWLGGTLAHLKTISSATTN